MARKPPDWRQPSLPFLPDPDNQTEPQDQSLSKTEGDHDAIQDDHSRTSATTATNARAASPGADVTADDGTLRQGAADPPPGVEGTAPGATAGQRIEPDRERSPGNGSQGTGGSFAGRVSGERRPD